MDGIFGYDFGIKPRVMVIGDVEFPHLLRKANLVGLGYDIIPQFGLLVNAPMITLLFEKEAPGRECFEHFKGWGDVSNDSDALAVSFVESLRDDCYYLFLYPETDHLINRCFDKFIIDEIEPIFSIAVYCKPFPLSDNYRWFKNKSINAPFVIAPGTLEGPFIDLAIRKRKIEYYDRDNMREYSLEYQLLNNMEQCDEDNKLLSPPQHLQLAPEDIFKRRASNIKKYFPVTKEQLFFSSHFQDLTSVLVTNGFREWQVEQAACNTIAKARFHELKDDSDISEYGYLRFLLETYEDVSTYQLKIPDLSENVLVSQIHADSLYLIGYFRSTDNIEDKPKVYCEIESPRVYRRLGCLSPSVSS